MWNYLSAATSPRAPPLQLLYWKAKIWYSPNLFRRLNFPSFLHCGSAYLMLQPPSYKSYRHGSLFTKWTINLPTACNCINQCTLTKENRKDQSQSFQTTVWGHPETEYRRPPSHWNLFEANYPRLIYCNWRFLNSSSGSRCLSLSKTQLHQIAQGRRCFSLRSQFSHKCGCHQSVVLWIVMDTDQQLYKLQSHIYQCILSSPWKKWKWIDRLSVVNNNKHPTTTQSESNLHHRRFQPFEPWRNREWMRPLNAEYSTDSGKCNSGQSPNEQT